MKDKKLDKTAVVLYAYSEQITNLESFKYAQNIW